MISPKPYVKKLPIHEAIEPPTIHITPIIMPNIIFSPEITEEAMKITPINIETMIPSQQTTYDKVLI